MRILSKSQLRCSYFAAEATDLFWQWSVSAWDINTDPRGVCYKRSCVAQAVSRWRPTSAARVRVRVKHVRFVVDQSALGQVFSEYFDFPCQSSIHQFTNFSIVIITRGWHSRFIGGRSAEWTPPPTIPIKTKCLTKLNCRGFVINLTGSRLL
jgi:hypothetical protein